MSRPSWDETWLRIAGIMSERSQCVNSQVAAVVVSPDNRFSWSGYNGPPRGLKRAEGPCTGWCPRAAGEGTGTSDYSACESIHAEVNALLRSDASLVEGGTMYVTRAPCVNCARVVANSGLSRVLCSPDPTDDIERAKESFALLYDSGLRAGYHGGPAEGRVFL